METYKNYGEEEFIGEGSFGNVYKFNKKGKVFAVKKILQHRLQDNISHEKDLLELVFPNTSSDIISPTMRARFSAL